MPFTLTHIAAVLPISRALPKLPFAALAIGSMTPDAPIFFSLGLGYHFLHSLPGSLLGCVPLGLAAFLLFERKLKFALVDIAPDFVQKRLAPIVSPHPINYRLTAIALLLGALSHIVWDNFSHAGWWGVDHVPFLQAHYSLFSHSIAGHELLQHGSSVVFLPVLLAIGYLKIARLPAGDSLEKTEPRRRRYRRHFQIAICLAPIACSLALWLFRKQNALAFLFESTVLTGIAICSLLVAFTLIAERSKSRR